MHKSKISRRGFVNLSASGALLVAVNPFAGLLPDEIQKASKWPSDAQKYRFHMIGHAHIDPVWLWPWSEGIALVHSTFRSALDRMNETEDLTFVSSSAQFYQWVAENDPSMLSEIRKRVNEGRWNIVGGWWVEPDVNMPCGESLVRHGLYGQQTLEKLLGSRAKVAFNPDSFGHPGTLPQILMLQGMENYVFMRPAQHEKSIPSDLFWWEGPDGTKVLTYRIQFSYNDNASVKNRIESILSQSVNQPMKSFMAFYGVGDHGGGATKENIRSIGEVSKEKGAPVIFYSTPEKYFDEIRSQKDLNLPVIKDDLQHHAPGCYTAESAIKKGNRNAEYALITAEKISAIGSISWNCNYPFEELTSAWKRVLFLQFHDSLAGTSLYEHSETVKQGHGYAMDIADQAIYKSLQKLEWQIPAKDPASQYIIVFNPHAWEINSLIEYDLNWNDTASSRIEDEAGNSLLHQWTGGSTETGSRKKLLVRTSIPAMGYRQLRLLAGDGYKEANPVLANDNTIENEHLRLRITEDGSVALFDKNAGREIFSSSAGGCQALVIDDPSDTWSHDIKSFSKVIGAFEHGYVKVIEKGPLRAVIRSKTTYGNSTLTIDWILCSGSGSIEAKVSLDWNERLKMLKFSFPLDVADCIPTYENPYGVIERSANGDEDPGQRWIDLTGNHDGKKYGLTIINNAKYGYSVNGNDMRISIARSAVYAHHKPHVLDMNSEHLWMDQGIQNFKMLLVPHSGSWQDSYIPRIAEEFMSPALTIYQGIHEGTLEATGSLLSVDPGNIIISSVKKAENSENIILRCVETTGKSVSALLRLKFAGLTHECKFRQFEIKTFSVDKKSGKITEVNLLEEQIA